MILRFYDSVTVHQKVNTMWVTAWARRSEGGGVKMRKLHTLSFKLSDLLFLGVLVAICWHCCSCSSSFIHLVVWGLVCSIAQARLGFDPSSVWEDLELGGLRGGLLLPQCCHVCEAGVLRACFVTLFHFMWPIWRVVAPRQQWGWWDMDGETDHPGISFGMLIEAVCCKRCQLKSPSGGWKSWSWLSTYITSPWDEKGQR